MPNDPNSYFQSYSRQIRAHAAQYAAGDPQSTRKDPFPVPDYFGKPRLGTSLKTTFNNGALPDPVNYQPSSTFHQLFKAPADVARDVAGHVVLEGPSGQNTKRQLGLPYKTHSIVDPEAAANFNPEKLSFFVGGLPHDPILYLSQGLLNEFGYQGEIGKGVHLAGTMFSTAHLLENIKQARPNMRTLKRSSSDMSEVAFNRRVRDFVLSKLESQVKATKYPYILGVLPDINSAGHMAAHESIHASMDEDAKRAWNTVKRTFPTLSKGITENLLRLSPGYKDNLGEEAFAYLASGDYKALGLSEKDHTKVLNKFMTTMDTFGTKGGTASFVNYSLRLGKEAERDVLELDRLQSEAKAKAKARTEAKIEEIKLQADEDLKRKEAEALEEAKIASPVVVDAVVPAKAEVLPKPVAPVDAVKEYSTHSTLLDRVKQEQSSLGSLEAARVDNLFKDSLKNQLDLKGGKLGSVEQIKDVSGEIQFHEERIEELRKKGTLTNEESLNYLESHSTLRHIAKYRPESGYDYESMLNPVKAIPEVKEPPKEVPHEYNASSKASSKAFVPSKHEGKLDSYLNYSGFLNSQEALMYLATYPPGHKYNIETLRAQPRPGEYGIPWSGRFNTASYEWTNNELYNASGKKVWRTQDVLLYGQQPVEKEGERAARAASHQTDLYEAFVRQHKEGAHGTTDAQQKATGRTIYPASTANAEWAKTHSSTRGLAEPFPEGEALPPTFYKPEVKTRINVTPGKPGESPTFTQVVVPKTPYVPKPSTPILEKLGKSEHTSIPPTPTAASAEIKEGLQKTIGTRGEDWIKHAGVIGAVGILGLGAFIAAQNSVRHVNLETRSGKQTKKDLDLPYHAHSTVDAFKAAWFTAKKEFQNTFGKSILDRYAAKLGSHLADGEEGKSVLSYADSFFGGVGAQIHDTIQSNPAAHAVAERYAKSASSFQLHEKDDFGKAWGDLHHSFADLGGYAVDPGEITDANRKKLPVSQFLLRNALGPSLLLGLTFVPLVMELGTELKHQFHKHVAKNMAEEHHNLETPTGRHLKDIMGLPYESHSRVDVLKAAGFFEKVTEAFNPMTHSFHPGEMERLSKIAIEHKAPMSQELLKSFEANLANISRQEQGKGYLGEGSHSQRIYSKDGLAVDTTWSARPQSYGVGMTMNNSHDKYSGMAKPDLGALPRQAIREAKIAFDHFVDTVTEVHGFMPRIEASTASHDGLADMRKNLYEKIGFHAGPESIRDGYSMYVPRESLGDYRKIRNQQYIPETQANREQRKVASEDLFGINLMLKEFQAQDGSSFYTKLEGERDETILTLEALRKQRIGVIDHARKLRGAAGLTNLDVATSITGHTVGHDASIQEARKTLGLPLQDNSPFDLFKVLKFPTLVHDSQIAVEHIAKPKYIQYRPKFDTIFVKTASEGAPVTLSLLKRASGLNIPSALSGSSISNSYVRSKIASLMGNTEVALLHQEHIAALKEALKAKSSTINYVQQTGSVSDMRSILRHEGFHAMQKKHFGEIDQSPLGNLGHGSQFAQNPAYKKALKANLGMGLHYRIQSVLGLSIGRVEVSANLVSGFHHSLGLDDNEAYSLLKDYTHGQVKQHGPDKVISAFQNTSPFAKDALRDVLSETHPEHYQSYGTQYVSDFRTGRISGVAKEAREERLKFSRLQYRTSVEKTRESRRNLTPERIGHAQELLEKHGVSNVNAFESKLDSLPESHPLYLETKSDYSTARRILQAPASITRLKQQRVDLRKDIRESQSVLDRAASAKAIPPHVVLPDQASKDMQARMGLPYKAHSVVDPIDSANATHLQASRSRLKLNQEGFSAVWRGKAKPTLFVNKETMSDFSQGIGQLSVNGAFTKHSAEEVAQYITSPEAQKISILTGARKEPSFAIQSLASVLREKPAVSNFSIIQVSSNSSANFKYTQRHENMHAQQSSLGELDPEVLKKTDAALKESPHYFKASTTLIRPAYSEEKVPVELPVWAATGGRADLGLSREASLDLTYRHANDALDRLGSGKTKELYKTALPTPKGLVRHLSEFDQEERNEIKRSIGNTSLLSDENIARFVSKHENLESPTGKFLKKLMSLPYHKFSTVDPIASANATHLSPKQRRINFAELTAHYEAIDKKIHKGFDIEEHLTPEALIAHRARNTQGFQGDPYKPSYHVEVAKIEALKEDRNDALRALIDSRQMFPDSKSTDYMFEPSKKGPARKAFKQSLLENPEGGHAQFIIRGHKDPVAYANDEGMEVVGHPGSFGVNIGNSSGALDHLNRLQMFHGVTEEERVKRDLLDKLTRSGGDANIVSLNPDSTASELFSTRRHELHHRKQAKLGEFTLGTNTEYREAMEESPYFKNLSDSLTRRGYPEASHGAEATAHLAHGKFGRTLTSSSQVAALDITYRAANDVMSRKGAEAGKELFSASVPVPKGLVKALAGFSQEDRDHIKENIGRTSFGTMFQKFQDENPNELVDGSFGKHIHGQFQDYLKSNKLEGPSTEMKAAMKVAGHVNLESPTGKFLKKVLSLPYHEFSTVDPLKAAREFFAKVAHAFKTKVFEADENAHTPSSIEFPEVNSFFNGLEGKYGHLIGKPRRVLKALYDLQSSAYAYFAQHDNVYLSTFARTMLMAEKVEHVMDYTYKFSPGRQVAKLFRSAVGATKRDYSKLALQGIETGIEHSNLRRIVKVGGVAIGIAESVLGYLHTYHKLSKAYHKYVNPDKDPEEAYQNQLERDRRKGYKLARRLGQRYDPTLASRQRKRSDGKESLLVEILDQINPFAALGRMVEAFRDPRKHIQAVSMYGAFGVLLGFVGLKTKKHLEHEVEKSFSKTAYTFGAEMLHYLGKGMQAVTAFGGVVGFAFGRSSSARVGAFSNVIATLLADAVGTKLGNLMMDQKWGQKFAGQVALTLGRLPEYLEFDHPWFNDKFKAFTDLGKELYKAGTSEKNSVITAAEEDAIKVAKGVASKIGMEFGGVLLEGTILIPLRKLFLSAGHRLDKNKALNQARHFGTNQDRQDRKKQRENQTNDIDLRRFLSTFSLSAYSTKDLLSNTDYTYTQRGALFLLRKTDAGARTLDAIAPTVTMFRRITSGARAIFTTRVGKKKKKEDWRIRLTRTYNAPAYSSVDIATNPQYSVPQRIFLTAFSHTDRGSAVLQAVSPAVTNIRKVSAWKDGLSHPHQIGEHAVSHVLQRGHHAVRHAVRKADEKAHENGASAAVADVLHSLSGAANDTSRAVKDAQRSSSKKKSKVKIRTHARTQDHALDENMLHNAYSRYINYGHEGDALSYNTQDQN